MTRQEIDRLFHNLDNSPAAQEHLARIAEADSWIRADIEHDMSKPGPSGGKGILAGLAVMSFSAVAVVAVIGWPATLFWEGLIKRFVDAIAFFLLLAVWLAAYAVLNPAEAATGDVSASAFSLFAAVGLAAVTSALVIAYAIVTKPRVRR